MIHPPIITPLSTLYVRCFQRRSLRPCSWEIRAEKVFFFTHGSSPSTLNNVLDVFGYCMCWVMYLCFKVFVESPGLIVS